MRGVPRVAVVEAHHVQIARDERFIHWLTDALKSVVQSKERAMQTVQGAIQTNNETLLIAVPVGIRG